MISTSIESGLLCLICCSMLLVNCFFCQAELPYSAQDNVWTIRDFSGNHLNQSGSATAYITIGHFLNTGNSPHIFMGLSAGSHMVKIVPNGCGRNQRPVSTSFVVMSYVSGL